VTTLSHNNEELFMFSPDAAKAVSNLEGLYNKLSVPDDNFYVKGYSGDPVVVHRKSRPPVSLRSPCISLLWLLQPDLLERMLQHRRLNDGGFLPRLTICDTQLVPTGLRRASIFNIYKTYPCHRVWRFSIKTRSTRSPDYAWVSVPHPA
jgi:hypothetical protein